MGIGSAHQSRPLTLSDDFLPYHQLALHLPSPTPASGLVLCSKQVLCWEGPMAKPRVTCAVAGLGSTDAHLP